MKQKMFPLFHKIKGFSIPFPMQGMELRLALELLRALQKLLGKYRQQT